MMSCRQVTVMVASGALESAGWRTRLAIRFHQLMCHHCRRYARQIAAISWAAGRLLQNRGDDLDDLERKILQRIPKH